MRYRKPALRRGFARQRDDSNDLLGRELCWRTAPFVVSEDPDDEFFEILFGRAPFLGGDERRSCLGPPDAPAAHTLSVDPQFVRLVLIAPLLTADVVRRDLTVESGPR